MAKSKEKANQEQQLNDSDEVIEKEDVTQQADDKLQKELNDLNDKYLRLAAEYDNFRKRSQKERETVFSDAKSSVLTELLPVIDNYDRANEITDTTLEEYKKGIDMTFSQLLQTFEKLGVESFGVPNDKFDPNIHNAVMHIEDDNFEENTITDVFVKGYKMGDKILRPAMVKVAN